MTGFLWSRPGPDDDQIEFDSDMAYLKDLAAAILAELPGCPKHVVARWVDRNTYLQAEVIRAVNQ